MVQTRSAKSSTASTHSSSVSTRTRGGGSTGDRAISAASASASVRTRSSSRKGTPSQLRTASQVRKIKCSSCSAYFSNTEAGRRHLQKKHVVSDVRSILVEEGDDEDKDGEFEIDMDSDPTLLEYYHAHIPTEPMDE